MPTTLDAVILHQNFVTAFFQTNGLDALSRDLIVKNHCGACNGCSPEKNQHSKNSWHRFRMPLRLYR